MSRWEIAPVEEEGFAPSTPLDPRTRLPIEERKVSRTVLANGTVRVSYDDAPLGDAEPELPPLLANAEELLGDMLDGGLSRKDRPKPPKAERGSGKWERLR